uniref:Uncharacterized protein n=1 Tax=Ananas comosus var. bracteatus TaxID=296719 RepID=A0A6V7Q4R2_ANACO|nr:unnamed protein product [Ananas comosus var. bracteatus]
MPLKTSRSEAAAPQRPPRRRSDLRGADVGGEASSSAAAEEAKEKGEGKGEKGETRSATSARFLPPRWRRSPSTRRVGRSKAPPPPTNPVLIPRVDIEKTKHQVVITRDIRKEIASINQKAEWDRREAEVAEELLPQRKEKQDEVTAANVAVRAAVGGNDLASRWQLMYKEAQQKREGPGKDSTSQAVYVLATVTTYVYYHDVFAVMMRKIL